MYSTPLVEPTTIAQYIASTPLVITTDSSFVVPTRLSDSSIGQSAPVLIESSQRSLYLLTSIEKTLTPKFSLPPSTSPLHPVSAVTTVYSKHCSLCHQPRETTSDHTLPHSTTSGSMVPTVLIPNSILAHGFTSALPTDTNSEGKKSNTVLMSTKVCFMIHCQIQTCMPRSIQRVINHFPLLRNQCSACLQVDHQFHPFPFRHTPFHHLPFLLVLR